MQLTVTNTTARTLVVGNVTLRAGQSTTITGVGAVDAFMADPRVHSMHQNSQISITTADDRTRFATPLTSATQRDLVRAVKSVVVPLGTLAAGSNQEPLVFTTQIPVFIVRLSMATISTVAAHTTNYCNLNFLNKGVTGASNLLVFGRSTQTGASNIITFSPHDPVLIGSGSGLTNSAMGAGSGLSLQKIDFNAGVALPGCVVTVEYVFNGRLPDMTPANLAAVTAAEK